MGQNWVMHNDWNRRMNRRETEDWNERGMKEDGERTGGAEDLSTERNRGL